MFFKLGVLKISQISQENSSWSLFLVKMKLSLKDFFSKCEQIRSFLGLHSHLLKKTSFFVECKRNHLYFIGSPSHPTRFREKYLWWSTIYVNLQAFLPSNFTVYFLCTLYFKFIMYYNFPCTLSFSSEQFSHTTPANSFWMI